jgi:hypothetical protein
LHPHFIENAVGVAIADVTHSILMMNDSASLGRLETGLHQLPNEIALKFG